MKVNYYYGCMYHQHQLSKNVLIEYMTEMKMGTWILQIHLFNYKICITEKATHM